jgi:hypothetical protein
VALPVSEQYVLDGIEKQLKDEYPQLDHDFASFASLAGPAAMPDAERLMAGCAATSSAHRGRRTGQSALRLILCLLALVIAGALLAATAIIAWSAGQPTRCPAPARPRLHFDQHRTIQPDRQPSSGCAMTPPK